VNSLRPHDRGGIVAKTEPWRAIVASSLDWEQAHVNLDHAVEGLAPPLRGQRPAGLPHSVWELLEHIRRAQKDLLDFCANPQYNEEDHEDHWPPTPAPPNDAAWTDSIAAIRRDGDAFNRFTTDSTVDLTTRIPHGTGQTYLRTILVAVDHTAYHVGQIIQVRRLLKAWPSS
jgi:uncharacterized damage-inducible protein DinB